MAVEVKITTTEINQWSTIQRCMITSINAAAGLGRADLVDKLTAIKTIANNAHDTLVRRKMRDFVLNE